MQIIVRMVMMQIIMRTMNFSDTRMTFEKRPDLKLSQGERENQFGADFFKCLKEEKSSKLNQSGASLHWRVLSHFLKGPSQVF